MGYHRRSQPTPSCLGTVNLARIADWDNAGSLATAKLDRLEGVRVEVARVYPEMESGRRDSRDSSRLEYVLAQVAKVLEPDRGRAAAEHPASPCDQRFPVPIDSP